MSDDSGTAPVNSVDELGKSPAQIAARWKTEIALAKKDRSKWVKQCKKIAKRYRDERPDNDTSQKLNILWSNVQTLGPAIYARSPKPIVERRFLDRDPVGRVASQIMERVLGYQIEVGYYHRTLKQARDDYLLTAQGSAWVRYEPDYADVDVALTATEDKKPAAAVADAGDGYDASSVGVIAPPAPQQIAGAVPGADPMAAAAQEPYQEVVNERTCVDFVHYTDYLTSPARVEEEIGWKARRAFLTREQIKKRFTKLTREQIAEIPLDHAPEGMSKDDASRPENEMLKKATVWEIWDKVAKQVIFIAEQWTTMPLEVVDDPLHLEGFWPTPQPIMGTTTNDSVVPVPDYRQYQDQAKELDDLTTRIGLIIDAIRVAGVYDSSFPALRRLLDDGAENKLYPVDSWAAFAEKGGILGAVSFLPIKEMADVLVSLYQARQQVKSDLYEVTGISDIVRGFSDAGAPKTATEQRIKGQFANLRLTDRQAEMARFARDILCIMAEMIAEHFSAETIYKMSGFAQWGVEAHLPPDMQQQPQQPQQPPAPPPGMGHNGGPALDGAQPPMPGMPAPPPPPSPEMLKQAAMQQAKAAADAQFAAAVKLLKDEKLRGFRITIETDSTIEPDQEAEKQARVEFLGAVSQFLEKALMVAQTVPQITPLLGKLLLFGVRGFKAGRELETAFEEGIAKLEQQAAQPQQPPPPSPEEIKTKAMAEQAAIQLKTAQQEAAIRADAARQQADIEAQAAARQQQADDQKRALDAEAKSADSRARMAEAERREQLEAAAHQRAIEKANLDASVADRQANLQRQAEQDKLDRELVHRQRTHEQELVHTAQKHEMERAHVAFKAHHERELLKDKASAAKSQKGSAP